MDDGNKIQEKQENGSENVKQDSKKSSKRKNEEVEKLKERIRELEEQVKRVLADYQNLQKRTNEEREEWIKTANKNLILDLLPGLNYLEKALKGAKDSGEQSGWLQGVEMSVQELRRALEKEGLGKVQTEKFDPGVHEVIEARAGPEGAILDVFEMGYNLNGKLVKPAKVAVGKG